MALNRQFCTAAGPANGAEMTQIPRLARLLPPRAIWDAAAANVGENAAENAEAKIFNTKTQWLRGTERRHKDA